MFIVVIRTLILIFVIILLLLIIQPTHEVGLQIEAGDFCYHEDDCDTHSAKWPGICKNGRRQSPINLSEHPWKIPRKGVKLRFQGYVSQDKFYMRNNGHTVSVQFLETPTSYSYVTGYELDEQYTFAQAHFHWGERDGIGSEHLIDGKSHSMEMHLVHYSSKYNSLQEAGRALDDPKAFAVFGVFFKVGSKHDDFLPLTPVKNHLTVAYQPTVIQVNETLDLNPFLPQKNAPFWRYMGSLTTPNCTESVVWTIFRDPVLISHDDLKVFRRIWDKYGDVLTRNIRPPQLIHVRRVQYIYKL